MPATTRTRVSASALLVELRAFGPAIDAGDLVFDAHPPADLDALLRVLHTGVRSRLTGKRWYGCSSDTGRVQELNPADPIPPGITLLCVEGDSRWDRLGPSARLDHAALSQLRNLSVSDANALARSRERRGSFTSLWPVPGGCDPRTAPAGPAVLRKSPHGDPVQARPPVPRPR